jgi:AcrR family transcriptional regulator
MASRAESTSRKARTDTRKREVLEAALVCYRAGGAGAVTIEAVAARSAASVGSIYHHFGSKEGILAALFREAIGSYRAGLARVVGQKRDVEALVKGVVRHYVQWIAEHPEQARMIFELRRLLRTSDEDAPLESERLGFYEPLLVSYREAVAQGRLHDLPFHVAVALMVGPANELARAWLRAPRGDFKRYATPLAEAAFRALCVA